MFIRCPQFRFLLSISFLVLALHSEEAAAQKSFSDAADQWPESLSGRVITVDGKPILDANVTFGLQKIHELESGRWDEVVCSRKVQSDERGVFRIPTKEIPFIKHRPLLINFDVTVDGYADGKKWIWYGPGKPIEFNQDNIAIIKLAPGRLVVGRCVDPAGSPVVGAVVKTASGHSSIRPRVDVHWNPTTTDKAGRFYLRVPDDGQVTINSWISHSNWAPQIVELPLDTNLFRQNIVLNKGGILSGTVRTIDGKPAVGVVVSARSQADGNVEHLTFPVNISVKTDARGRYQLPPLEGEYRIFLTEAGRNDNDLSNQFVVGHQTPPLVVPQLVSLKAGEIQVLDFDEQPKITVSGRVSWPNGDPVAEHDVQPYFMSTNFGTGIWLIKTVTDDDGDYAIEIPKDMPEIGLQVLQAKDKAGNWNWAHLAESAGVTRKFVQMATIELAGENRSNIDWIMRENR